LLELELIKPLKLVSHYRIDKKTLKSFLIFLFQGVICILIWNELDQIRWEKLVLRIKLLSALPMSKHILLKFILVFCNKQGLFGKTLVSDSLVRRVGNAAIIYHVCHH
jgi:hypothetical protein